MIPERTTESENPVNAMKTRQHKMITAQLIFLCALTEFKNENIIPHKIDRWSPDTDRTCDIPDFLKSVFTTGSIYVVMPVNTP